MPLPPPGDLSDPGIKPVSPAMASGLFMTVPLGSPWQWGSIPHLIKAVFDKPTANIFNHEKLKAFLLRSGTRQVYPSLLFSFNILFGVLATEIRQQKVLTGIQIGKEVKLLSFIDDIILYIFLYKALKTPQKNY